MRKQRSLEVKRHELKRSSCRAEGRRRGAEYTLFFVVSCTVTLRAHFTLAHCTSVFSTRRRCTNALALVQGVFERRPESLSSAVIQEWLRSNPISREIWCVTRPTVVWKLCSSASKGPVEDQFTAAAHYADEWFREKNHSFRAY